ncbi:hypothetical protein FIV50_13770 [Microbacterium foliorum]|uniref:Uncharacterized protein n=1 Tax=Microbacterium foliorum TaxID=104336 RepID=A0A4Y5YSC3_9MICO|nr:hypothetical protein [Microbacterium foliorum]QDE35762.1 hypothetical protein FIV50_13770 [Microbacterium foliorum]
MSTSPKIIVSPASREGGAAADVTVFDGRRSAKRQVWIESPAIDPNESSDLTSWLIALLPYAMRLGAEVELDGLVDHEVLSNVRSAQDILAGWYPERLQPVEVRAAGSVQTAQPATGNASFFSAGVDSFFTLASARQPVDFVLFVHGLDVALDDAVLASRIRQVADDAATEVGARSIPVTTNLKVFTRRSTIWGSEQHGATLAGVAYALRSQIGSVKIAASYSDEYIHPWGSHPDLDPLWSSTAQRVIHDASWATRIEKASLAMTLKSAREGMRVCMHAQRGYNCGYCEKCVRTRINILLAGYDGQCETLPPFDMASLERVSLNDEGRRAFAYENLRYLRGSGQDRPELDAALEHAIRKGELQERREDANKLIQQG